MLALLSKGRWLGVSAIATLTIRGLDRETHARLRVEAARHGRSMEAEVRAILRERLAPHDEEGGLGSRIRARFAGLEGELELPDRRREPPRAAVFDA
jgi:antitoxin FitA